MSNTKTAVLFLIFTISTSFIVILSGIQASANPTIDPRIYIDGARSLYVFGMILFLEAGVICLATGVGTKKGIVTVAVANIASSIIGLIIRIFSGIDPYNGGGYHYAVTIFFYFPVAVIAEWPFYYIMLWTESCASAFKKSFYATIYAQILSHIFLMIVIPAKISSL